MTARQRDLWVGAGLAVFVLAGILLLWWVAG